jgi:hypothetical protein
VTPSETLSSADLRYYKQASALSCKSTLPLKLLLKTNADFKAAADAMAKLGGNAVDVEVEKGLIQKGVPLLDKIITLLRNKSYSELFTEGLFAQLQNFKQSLRSVNEEDCKEEILAISAKDMQVKEFIDQAKKDSLANLLSWMESFEWQEGEVPSVPSTCLSASWVFHCQAYLQDGASLFYTQMAQVLDVAQKLLEHVTHCQQHQKPPELKTGLAILLEIHTINLCDQAPSTVDQDGVDQCEKLRSFTQRLTTAVIAHARTAIVREWGVSKTTSCFAGTKHCSAFNELEQMCSALKLVDAAQLPQQPVHQDTVLKDMKHFESWIQAVLPIFQHSKTLAGLQKELPSAYRQYLTCVEGFQKAVQEFTSALQLQLDYLTSESKTYVNYEDAVKDWNFECDFVKDDLSNEAELQAKTQTLQDAIDLVSAALQMLQKVCSACVAYSPPDSGIRKDLESLNKDVKAFCIKVLLPDFSYISEGALDFVLLESWT